MHTATASAGSAAFQGEIWSADPDGWALNEVHQAPVYGEVADRLGIGEGTTVLEVGCGTGVFLREAVDRGATAFGLDAADGLLAVARDRVPEADVRVGDLEFLPYDDGAFDAVAGFNAFQFASSMPAAIAEAARVTRPGGKVAIQVWGRADRCDLIPMIAAVGAFLPERPPTGPDGRALGDPGVLEGFASAAGLTAESTGDVTFRSEYADEATVVRAMLAAGLVALAARLAGEDTIRAAIVDALAPFRKADGSYRLENEWHYLIAAKPG